MREAILLKIILVIKKTLKVLEPSRSQNFTKTNIKKNYLVKYISDSYASPIAGKAIVVTIPKFNRWLPVQ